MGVLRESAIIRSTSLLASNICLFFTRFALSCGECQVHAERLLTRIWMHKLDNRFSADPNALRRVHIHDALVRSIRLLPKNVRRYSKHGEICTTDTYHDSGIHCSSTERASGMPPVMVWSKASRTSILMPSSRSSLQVSSFEHEGNSLSPPRCSAICPDGGSVITRA